MENIYYQELFDFYKFILSEEDKNLTVVEFKSFR